MAKKSGLGKGLSILISDTSAEAGLNNSKDSLQEIDIKKIQANPEQPRTYFNQTELAELSDSIASVGILQPLLLQKNGDKYQIIAGERRYQAALLAGLETVPAQIKELDEAEKFKIALIENLQRVDLNPIEEARGYKRLIDLESLTQEQLSQAVSKSRSTIANALRLLDLPEEVQNLLYEMKLSAGHARAILAIPDDELRIKLAHKVVADKLSVRETEKLAPLFSLGSTPKAKRASAPKSFKLAARQLRQKLGTNVKVKTVGGKNKIEIEFKDEEELSRILGEIS